MQTHNSCGLCSITLKDIQVVSGQDTLLDNINLQFHCGELTALIGKNGAGKTTLLKAILGERPVWWKIGKSEKKQIQEMLEDINCAYLADRRLGALSGGELQRVLLALATNPVPDLLILDEPVSGVDMAGLDLFYHRVTELRDKYHMAILLVSHDLSLIRRYADKVVLLDKTVIAQGDAVEVYSTDAFRSVFGYLEKEEGEV